MKFNRRDFNKVLAAMERGALVVAGAAMIFGMTLRGPAQKKAPQSRKPRKIVVIVKNPVFPVTQTKTAFFYCNNMRVNGDEYAGRKGWGHGAYNKYKNKARLNIVTDTAKTTSPKATDFITKFNSTKHETAYHELRHGLNMYWIGRVNGVDSIMLTADEYWARVAGKIALQLDMPVPERGDINLDINYKIPQCSATIISTPTYDPRTHSFKLQYGAMGVDRTTRKMADAAIGGAIDDLSQRFKIYALTQFTLRPEFRQKLALSAKQNRHKEVSYANAMDSMAMFRINDRLIYLPALASPETRARLDTFLYKFAPQQIASAQAAQAVR